MKTTVKDIAPAVQAFQQLQESAMLLIEAGTKSGNNNLVILGQLLNSSDEVERLKNKFTQMTLNMRIEKE